MTVSFNYKGFGLAAIQLVLTNGSPLAIVENRENILVVEYS